jgi:hypothetical protein
MIRSRCLVAVLLVIGLAGCSDTGGGSQSPPAATGPAAGIGQTQRLTFDQNTTLPASSMVFDGTWTIRPESGTSSAPNALCQTATATFPAIALTTDNYRDGTFTVRFKPISGKEDQAAGIIFRVRDRDNYYILRANALEGNVNFYTYINGKRSTLKEATAAVTAGAWHELRVEVTGQNMTSFLDGIQLATATDSTFTSGRVGLWTKADSQTCFDDLTTVAR